MEANEIKEILEWYIESGVEETAGDEPFMSVASAKAVPIDVAKTSRPTPTEVSPRKAVTALSQITTDACKSARELCKTAADLDELKKLVEAFDGCALKLTASHTVFGAGNKNAEVMFIGEAPGAEEDKQGLPFVGRSGQLLDKMLSSVGLKREDCYITNVLPWRPPGNRTPTDGEIAVCLPFLKRQIELINPKVLYLMGGSAASALLEVTDTISRLRGRWLEYTLSENQKIKTLASFHPAYLLRNPAQKAKAWADFLRLKQQLNENKIS